VQLRKLSAQLTSASESCHAGADPLLYVAASKPAPLQLCTDLTLQSGSPAFGQGIDPSTLSGLPSAIVSDLKNYIYTDINGKPRPQGGGSDLGAYQH